MPRENYCKSQAKRVSRPAQTTTSSALSNSIDRKIIAGLRASQTCTSAYDPQTCVRFVARRTTLLGYAVCAVACTAGALITAFNTAGWCGAQLRAAQEMLMWMFLLDALVAQPLLVAVTLAWRTWATGKGHIHHPLHPIHGQVLHVGRRA